MSRVHVTPAPRRHGPVVALALLAAALAAGVAPARAAGAATPPLVEPSLISGLRWRLVGPFRGGRVTAVTGVRGAPRTFYMGATGGGVWRTDDAGATWHCVSDSSFGTGSVGAVAVAPSDPNVVYVGMGEAPIRGNVSHGDGVYRSTDAGRTWTHLGLERTSQIARVRVDPRDPDRVYVAAQGRVFAPNAERGVYRSKDGGRTWQRVLFVNDSTGASDLALDPANPRILYAGFWQAGRKPWELVSGGPGSGLWKSSDGGDTWTRLSGDPASGLPKGILGKITVAPSAAKPGRVWAMVEAADGGLFRSDDWGRTWQRTNQESDLRQRAWYFSRCYADPQDPDRVYVLNVRLLASEDGGHTFHPVRAPHGDNHDLWIDPDDPRRMVEGNDGGATVSLDRGESWTTLENQPTAQFYHVVVDDQFPYRLYGSQQDNSTVSIPERTTGFGIEREDWFEVGGGESGWIAPKPGEPDVVYAGSYDGLLTRYDVRTHQSRAVDVYPDNPMGAGAEEAKYRFQWTYPIVASAHDPNVLYCAANVLFRTRNDGQTWEAISPDLTRNDPSKLGSSGGPITKDNTTIEYYCTIFALAESPRDAKVLWCGSDDGLIHVTRDGGATWRNVTPQGLPPWSQINHLEASPHDAATAYAAVVRYKLDDFAPYLYVTHDFGRTWAKIVNGLPGDAFVRAVREDPARKGLLFAGTETGAWVSFDDGAHWQSLRNNLPTVPVTDLVVKGDDLVIATQGRSFWVLDDITPLRQVGAATAREDLVLFAPGRAVRFAGRSVPRPAAGMNPPRGVRLRWWLPKALPDSVPARLDVLDAAARPVLAFDRRGEIPADTSGRQERGPKVTSGRGLNELVWDLDYPAATRLEGLALWGPEPPGPTAVPGRYRAKLTLGRGAAARTRQVEFEVVADPRLPASDADYREQFDLLVKIRDELGRAHDAVLLIRDARGQLEAAVARARRAGKEHPLADSARAIARRMTRIEEALVQTRSKSEEDPLNYPIRLDNKLSILDLTVASADARPTDASYAVWNDLRARTEAQLAALRRVLEQDVAGFNRLAREQDVPAAATKSLDEAAKP